MAATEFDILRDEQERNDLARTISGIEMAITASPPGIRRILEGTVENAKRRIATLDKKIEEAKVERAAEAQAQVAAAAALAAKETALNAKERETYKSFLEESYFTKKDFGRLDEFYTHSYDRLSEGGKEEMSERIDEGIRRGEFKAADLPESVQKRQTEHKHLTFKGSEEVEQSSHVDAQAHVQEGLSTVKVNDIDLSSVDLKGVKLVAVVSEPTVAAMPDVSASRVNTR